MTTKQKELIDEFIGQIKENYRHIFRELSEFVMNFSYNPVRNKTEDLSIDFKNNRTKKTVMKFEIKEQSHDGIKYGQSDIPGLRLKFFASKEYSTIFKKSIKRVIENFGGKYTGCYGCGRCKDGLEGYTYEYPDGRKVFRCGSEQISIFDFDDSNILEIKALLENQINYWNSSLNK